jgi:DNA-binding transcriptional LysR family regulator
MLERIGPRRLRLTEQGKALLPTLRETLARYDDLLAHLRGRQECAETVRLALGMSQAHLYHAQLLVAASRQSRWRVESSLTRGLERIRGVAEGRFDMALVTHSAADIATLSRARTLKIEELACHPLVLLAHPATDAGVKLAKFGVDQRIAAECLTRWPLVGLDEQAGISRNLQQQLHARGELRYATKNQPGGWVMAREYARQKLGVALLPQPLLRREDHAAFVVRGLSDVCSVKVFLVMGDGEATAPRAEVAALLRMFVRDGPE